MALAVLKTSGDQIVVRGKAAGTPAAEFWGAKPTGKSFDTTEMDIFTVKEACIGLPRGKLGGRAQR